MARPRLDKNKKKETTSIRLDDRDKKYLSKRFGSVQSSIDCFLSMLLNMSEEEIETEIEYLEYVRSKQGEKNEVDIYFNDYS